MTTVKLDKDLVIALRVLKAELSEKSYSTLILYLIEYYKDKNAKKVQ
jgi:hypothetical protein